MRTLEIDYGQVGTRTIAPVGYSPRRASIIRVAHSTFTWVPHDPMPPTAGSYVHLEDRGDFEVPITAFPKRYQSVAGGYVEVLQGFDEIPCVRALHGPPPMQDRSSRPIINACKHCYACSSAAPTILLFDLAQSFPHILNSPNWARSGIGALSAAAKAKPSTSRVWTGSMMPSSHRRAVA